MLRSATCALLLVWAIGATPAIAQDGDQVPVDLEQTIGQFKIALESDQAESSAKQTVNQATDSSSTAPQIVAALPTTTGQSAGFAERVNDSIADFLPLFQFAIQGVSTSDDGRSVTVNFNPVRSGVFGSLAVKATVSEPEPFAELLEKIPEADRSAQADAIRSALDDFGDITYTATYGYERNAAPEASLETVGRLWGRAYSRYDPLVSKFLLEWSSAVITAIDENEAAAQRSLGLLEIKLREGLTDQDMNLDNLTLAQAKQILGAEFNEFFELLVEERRQLADDAKLLKALALLPFLVDNQPQFTVTAAYRDRDDLVGRNSWNATLALEVGRHNFNTLVRNYQRRRATGAPATPAAAFADYASKETEIRSGQKFTLNVTWARTEDYSKTYPFGDAGASASLALEGSDEICGKLQWTRNATWHPMELQIAGKPTTVYPRLHLSTEYVDADGDEARRDRWVGTATYTIPLQGGMSLPFSLVYANHGRFLGETDEQFSAHFGINFKINEGSENTPPGS